MAKNVSNPAAVYANLVRNGMSLALVPDKWKREVELIVASSDITFDLNSEDSFSGSNPIIEYKTLQDFPNIGISNRLYMAGNNIYRWDSDSMSYINVSTDVDDIKIIDGGNSHG